MRDELESHFYLHSALAIVPNPSMTEPTKQQIEEDIRALSQNLKWQFEQLSIAPVEASESQLNNALKLCDELHTLLEFVCADRRVNDTFV